MSTVINDPTVVIATRVTDEGSAIRFIHTVYLFLIIADTFFTPRNTTTFFTIVPVEFMLWQSFLTFGAGFMV